MYSLKVENGRELRKALRQTEDGMADLKEANAKVADLVARAARSSAPRRSGRLAGSVKGNRAAARAVVSTRLRYAPFVHWGARGVQANPFVTKAAEATEDRWVGMYQENVQQVIDRNMGTVG